MFQEVSPSPFVLVRVLLDQNVLMEDVAHFPGWFISFSFKLILKLQMSLWSSCYSTLSNGSRLCSWIRKNSSTFLVKMKSFQQCEGGVCCPVPMCSTGSIAVSICGMGNSCPIGFVCEGSFLH